MHFKTLKILQIFTYNKQIIKYNNVFGMIADSKLIPTFIIYFHCQILINRF